ncbi:Cytochrome P450 monooxygenase ATR2 [Colletotrichum sp. SAR 10_66]|nr:Cytochrome P450 monooxygenase ATR2 [Colletotrichum sp. SAR 10_75]KAJ5008366.1 Cytochrome P450 monooxygenase ATR2 [Colletotrichum sp. SAR 10_66]
MTASELPTVVIPPKFIPELKKLSDTVLGFQEATDEAINNQYLDIPTDTTMLAHTVKVSLTPALAIAAEVTHAIDAELPPCKDWTEVPINNKLFRIVAMASGRVFVGPELCRNEAYLDTAINYTVDMVNAVLGVMGLPAWRRRFSSRRLPEVKKLFQRFKEAEDFLGPVVTARRDAMAKADYEKPDDMLQWLIDAQDKSKNGSRNDAELAIWQLGASFTAIHTTTATATNALYTLASMQDIIPVLREEIQEALVGSGNEFNNAALQNMVKLESFLTESMRTYPMSAANAQRKVLQPFTLSNGQTIPAGVLIELPSAAVNMDDNLYPSSSQFDAFRFSKLRQNKVKATEDGTEVGHLFSSVGQTSLNFGFGRHVCPGRFFASVEIKMIVAIILLNFDVLLAEGETERYKNVEIGVQATGLLGSEIASALQKAGFIVTAIRRAESTAPVPVGMESIQLDINDTDALTSAFQGQDAVISAAPDPISFSSQKHWIDAAIAAGVKRIFPSEYSTNLDSPLAETLPVVTEKVSTRRYLVEQISNTAGKSSWTSVNNGPFFELVLGFGGLGPDFRTKTAKWHNGGANLVGTTRLPDIAETVCKILKDDNGLYGEAENKSVYIHSAVVTEKQLTEMAEKVTGQKFLVEERDVEQVYQEAKERLQKGDKSGMMLFYLQMMYGKGYGGSESFQEMSWNEKVGLKTLTEREVEDIVRGVAEKSGPSQ